MAVVPSDCMTILNWASIPAGKTRDAEQTLVAMLRPAMAAVTLTFTLTAAAASACKACCRAAASYARKVRG